MTHCSSDKCCQGRRCCPTPQACEIPEPDPDPSPPGRGTITAILLGALFWALLLFWGVYG